MRAVGGSSRSAPLAAPVIRHVPWRGWVLVRLGAAGFTQGSRGHRVHTDSVAGEAYENAVSGATSLAVFCARRPRDELLAMQCQTRSHRSPASGNSSGGNAT